ncbi:MAG TPA: PfkB family carbohydrate kinase [Miltoncostaea sp.]|nr:PfkB family carbohydrate kinase [Miltoncostaea sp.]
MEIEIGRGKRGRRAYGLDEIAIVPSRRTRDPEDVVSTVGSGDALLAGYVSARYGNQPPEKALALAVACGAANTQRFGAGVFDPADVEALMRRVEVVIDED